MQGAKKLRRLRRILAVGLRYGADEALARLGSGAAEAEGGAAATGTRLRRLCEDLGPTFVKLGQVLSLRSDVLDPAIADALRGLQDDVRPAPAQDVRAAVEAALGRPLERAFAEFDFEPVAAASLAQVHAARTPDGRKVAVKVRRPGVRSVVEADLALLRDLAAFAERRGGTAAVFRPLRVVDELRRAMDEELDFAAEARNMEAVRRLFAGTPGIRVPAPRPGLCAPSVLTMDFMDGVRLSDRTAVAAAGIDRAALAERGASFVLTQVFEHRFFNADPHPGNFIVLRDLSVAPLDYGLMGRVDDRLLELLREGLRAFLDRDPDRAVRMAARLELADEESTDFQALRRDLWDLFASFDGLQPGSPELTRVFLQVADLVRRHRLDVPPDFTLALKALATLEGLARELDPRFDYAAAAEPFVRRLVLRELSPAALARRAGAAAEDAARLGADLPAKADRALSRLASGRLRIRVRHEDLDGYVVQVDKSINRLAFSVVIAALLIGSSSIAASGAGGTVFGVSLLGLAGYSAAGILSAWFLFGILKSGKL